MKRFSIAARLWAPSLALGACLVLAGGGTAVRTIKLLEEARVAQTSQQHKLLLAAEGTGAAEAQGVRQLALMALPEDQRAALSADVQKGQAKLDQLNAQLREHVKASDETAALADAQAKQAAFQSALAKGPEAAAPALQSWLAAQAAFAKLQEAKGDALREQVAKDRMRTVWSVIGLMAVIVAVVSISTAFLVRTICGPLALLRNVAERVGRGDLSVQIHPGRNDEIGDVLHSVEEMRNALRSVVGQVRQSADSVRVLVGTPTLVSPLANDGFLHRGVDLVDVIAVNRHALHPVTSSAAGDVRAVGHAGGQEPDAVPGRQFDRHRVRRHPRRPHCPVRIG